MWYKIFICTVICVLTYILKALLDSGPNKVKFHFKFFIFYFVTSLVSAVVWPYFLLSPKNVKNAKFSVRFIKPVTKLYDLEWHLRDGNILAEDRGAVIISNHQNSLDILGMFNIWDVIDKLAAVAKKELFYIWPFGLMAYLAGVVFIDRSNAKIAYKQLEVTSEVVLKNKTKIWLFPEGTRNKDYTKLLPFKKGAFNIAVSAQVPILPVVFSPYYFINKEKYIFNKGGKCGFTSSCLNKCLSRQNNVKEALALGSLRNAGHIIIQCLEPIPTVGLTLDDVPDLINKVHQKMTIAYKELSKEVISALPADYPFTLKG